ncbi:hypothetical protein GCM10025868_26170 [Angustibacter aerolatus]|uniref:phosphoribosylaminoimidazolesuccinocarboxamide synthase n=1 Tax=Angustibacter aerolatus TaxID=1162965 RepID=A0ABQ6JHZ8_9ACTN|nr:phosphoribosylaminoimidazolesuccinocarboxamide synthase [Angustibacter aerolatus]GMA87367.1 hypothetical protein GCM10025868_26170 [Angustibacter aerolatus]
MLTLGDEVLTPDSSRFWPADEWAPGRAQPSFDKQFVRDWLRLPGVRLGPARRRPAAPAAGRRRRAHPRPVRRGVRAPHRHPLRLTHRAEPATSGVRTAVRCS